MRLKSIIASAFTALMVACPVLAFSESADFDDSVPDTDETMTIDTPASNADSNDVAWLSASKDTATQVTALIMAGASVVAYIIGEGLTDAACIEDETEK